MYCNDKSSSTASRGRDGEISSSEFEENDSKIIALFIAGHVTMREKKSGALSRVQKLKKRLSHSFSRLCKFLFSDVE